jgi:uncharacterized protein DUF5915
MSFPPGRRDSSRWEPMARCPLCESDVPDGRPGCDACGQVFDRPLTPNAVPEVVRRSIEGARKDLVASTRDPADVAFPRSLLERAEKAEAAGELGKALDLAHAARRALDIIRREGRVAAALLRVEAVLEEAKKTGVDTLAFERTVEQARARSDRGDQAAAERLLQKISLRDLDQRRERVLQGSLEKAETLLRYAKERGGQVERAEALLAEAKQALAIREYDQVRSLAARAIEAAETGRRFARAEDIVDRAATEVEVARKEGVNIAEARKFLTQARDALQQGVYADIPLLAAKARHSLREGRVGSLAESALRESQREAARERRKGADVGRSEKILEAAEAALANQDFAAVRGLAKDAHDAVREATLLKTVREAFASLQLDAEDLKKLGADATAFEGHLIELSRAIEAGDLATARRLLAEARRTAETAREAHVRAYMERSLHIILTNAARGLDPVVARQLLQEVDDSIALGKPLDMQALIDKRMADQDATTEEKLNGRVLQSRDDIVALRQAGQNDTVALEGKLADAAIGVQDRRFLQADALLDSIEHDIAATRESLRSSAAEVLGQARGEVTRARADGVPIEAAERMLKDAESSYQESRYGDTIYAGKACISEVDELARLAVDSRRRTDAEQMRVRLERTEGIHRRMEVIRSQITDLVAQNVDLARAVDGLAAAEQAIDRGALDQADQLVASAEGIVEGVKVTLTGQAHDAFARTEKAFQEAKAEGLETPDVGEALARADQDLRAGRPGAALQTIGDLERRLSEARRTRFQVDQRRTMEKARAAATKFIAVKRLIEGLRKADIDISGAEESLRAAERALQQRAFDDVDAILKDLDATAKDLMEELVVAAKNLIARAQIRIADGRETGVPVDGAIGLLQKAESHFERGEYADAVEHARAAEQKIVEMLKLRSDEETVARYKAQDVARAQITKIKKTINDLSRADITIMGADTSLGRADAAFDAGRFEDVPRELADTVDMAKGLTMGLEAAAKDLVRAIESEVDKVRSSGIDPGRADMVLQNAREAIEDHRFVEAIEYKKVIEDILGEARRGRDESRVRDALSELRAKLDAHSKLGADVRMASELLARAEALVDAGEYDDVDGYAKRVADEIDIARRSHLTDIVEDFAPLINDGVAVGLPRGELEEFRSRAEEAATADDIEEVYRLKGDLQERLLEAKRKQILKRYMDEINALEEIVTSSERLEIPAQSARTQLDAARQAIVQGDLDGFKKGLLQARAALEESRTKHFIDRYDTRVHAVSTMIANAKKLGAELGEAENSLAQAESALRGSDMAMADILIKQAEVSIGSQMQNFIKNRYPNLALRLPATGLQAGEWNQFTFAIENRGKLPARNVQIEFSGDLESKGVPTIGEIGVGEVVPVRVGLRPKSAGPIPLDVGISYQRLFDENRYEVHDAKEVRVEPEATYLVEDVFLIHTDGRLIAHYSRKFREEIDEDIFSGMLTVVQDFVKDSFKSRTRVGMKRLDFGDSKILIERSPHTFLATVLVGQEPRLLPLYMLQVLKEVEDRYGTVLERWSGLLHQVEGIDDVVKKLLLVPKEVGADAGGFADSPVTLTAKVIDALGAAQATEANELLARAQSTLETDIQLAWEFIEKARTHAEGVQGQLKERMADVLATARDTVKEMASIGVDVSQADLLLREAEEAFHEGKYERVQEIGAGLRESLERAKGEMASKKVEVELASLINDIQIAKSQGLDPREAESYLTKIEAAIQKGNHRQIDELLRRAKESIVRQRRQMVLDKARQDLDRLRATVAQAKSVQVDLPEVEEALAKAEAAIRSEDLRGLEPLIDRAEASAKDRVEQILKDRYPRLFLETSNLGLQANRWTRIEMQITNKGNWPAEHVTPIVTGPVEVQGLKAIDRLEPNQKASVEFGVRPKEVGTMDLDFEVHYTRPLDDSRHQTTDSVVVRVEPEGAYQVDHALLFHSTGALVCHETRLFLPPEDAARAANLENQLKAFVTKAFPDGGKGFARTTIEKVPVFVARGPQAFLAVTVRGKDLAILPLYMVSVLKDVHDEYGARLDAWTGDPAELSGIRPLLRRILFATATEGVSLGPLEDSPVSKVPALMERGLLLGEGDEDFLDWAWAAIKREGYDRGVQVLKRISDATVGPTEEISRQIQQAVLASKEAGTLQITDDQVNSYMDFLRHSLEATFQAKRRAGIERYWPVARLAVKAADAGGYDAVTAFRKIIVGQSGAKELDVVAPDETWRGMKIEVQVHMHSVSAAYKLWAKKIEILLRSQDAWKIKAGLERGEYAVGIEGQKVRIDPSMVSFVESLPDYVVEEPYEGGIVYLDTRMSKELVAEGYAKEIVELVREARKDMSLDQDRVVEIELVAGKDLRGKLGPWKDMILRDANALDVQFVSEPAQDAYVIEAGLGEETFLLGVRAAEM